VEEDRRVVIEQITMIAALAAAVTGLLGLIVAWLT
jgi:hypothetical protein